MLGVVLGSGEKLSELSPEGQQPFKPQGWAATAAPLQAVTSTHQVWAVQKYLTRTKSHVNMLVRGVTTEPTCWYAVTTAPTCWYGVTTAPTCWCTVSPRHQHAGARCHHGTNMLVHGVTTAPTAHLQVCGQTLHAIAGLYTIHTSQYIGTAVISLTTG